MTKDEIRAVLSGVLDPETEQVELPEARHWEALRARFGTEFSEDFIYFLELMSEFSFPGDILNVRTDGETNGNDGIEFTYDYEMNQGPWNSDMIPFYSIGNGDYFLLSAKEKEGSAVYYYYHEDQRVEKYCSSFEQWLRDLPDFLA